MLRVLPTDPDELLRQLLQFKKSSVTVRINSNNSDTNVTRQRQQEIDRESVEQRLMHFEDYLFSGSEEGKLRIRSAEDRMKMESEDVLSQQYEALQREADFKVKIRREAEKRKKQEQVERARRREEAEERRKAVVERIRHQQEAELRAKREAEEAILRIKEEEAREVERQRLILKRNRDEFAAEDEMSRLHELDYREEIARKQWREKERLRLLQWEQEQAEKDKLDAIEREKRQALLDEKKRKLAELKQSQSLLQEGANDSLQQQQQAALDEANKLSKQLRIQNKAKFVTKKLKTGSTAEEAIQRQLCAPSNASHLNLLPSAASEPGPAAASPIASSSLPHKAPLFQNSPMPLWTRTPDVEPEVTVPDEFIAKLDALTAEIDIKDVQRQLLSEKRSIRLQQQQAINADSTEIAQFRQRLAQLLKMEELTNLKLVQLMQVKHKAIPSMSVVDQLGQQPTETAPIQSSVSLTTSESSTEQPNRAAISSDNTFKRAEQLLKHGQDLISMPNKAAADSKQMLILSMEISELAKSIDATNDILEYRQKLHKMCNALKALSMGQTGSTEATLIYKEVTPVIASPRLTTSDDKKDAGSKPCNSRSSRLSGMPPPPSEDAPQEMKAAVEVVAGNSYASKRVAALPFKSEETLHTASPTVSQDNNVPPIESQNVSEQTKPTGDLSSSSVDKSIAGDSAVSADEGSRSSYLASFESLPGWSECLCTSMATAAHHAAYYGYVEVLELLTKVFDCFVVDSKGRTPLFYACLSNQLGCVVALVSIDPQWIDVGDERGDTPLHSAAISNGVEVLKFLLSACEVSPDTANFDGLTPSHVAKSAAALQVLCDYGAMPYCVDNRSRLPLHQACCDGRADCVRFLCEKTPSNFILWADEEGNSCLHDAASYDHSSCVEVVCQRKGVEELCTVNKKGLTAVHVAASASVLNVLYEYGCSMWIPDCKNRYPLFFASFFGRSDCVSFLLEVAISSNRLDLICHPDIQGDTALHAAALKGNMIACELLLYYLLDTPNNHKLRASQLAIRAGHARIANMIEFYCNPNPPPLVMPSIEERSKLSESIFAAKFNMLSATLVYYGSRYSKLYDVEQNSTYFYDRITGQSSWEQPAAFDMDERTEEKEDQARNLLIQFYTKFNPEKLVQINDILVVYKGKYTELFISLANKYEVEDLSMFAGVSFDD